MNAQTEEWRPVVGFPQYAVSSLGQIKRISPDSRNHRVLGKPLKQVPNYAGYAGVTLCCEGKKKNARVNRIVCEAFHGPAPSPDYHAAHNDGVRLNNRADNLRWVLGVENEADKRTHGTAAVGERHWSKLRPERRPRGSRHGLAKLNPEAVRAIRNDTRGQREIAAAYGVSQRAIWGIKNGKTWGHVA